MKRYNNISEVPSKYRWDVESVLDGQTVEQIQQNIKNIFKKLLANKKNFYASKEHFLEYLNLRDKLMIEESRLFVYLSCKISTNVVDIQINKILEETKFMIIKLEEELGPEDTDFFRNSKKIRTWLKLPEFKEHRRFLEKKLTERKHKLTKPFQNFLLKTSNGNIDVRQIFNILFNSEIDFGHAVSETGKRYKIAFSNIKKLLKNKSESVRKTALENFNKGFLDHKNTLSNMLFQHFKKVTNDAKLRKFNSTIEYLTYDDRIDTSLLTTLYEVHRENSHIYKKFKKWNSKFFYSKFKRRMKKYDKELEFFDNVPKYTIEQAKELVLNSVKPFGEEYHSVMQRGLNEEAWVDYLPVKNKASGAFSISFEESKKPLILMNFKEDLTSVSTLAHELGHSMHTYFSIKNNFLKERTYKILVAEIASTFNEIMLADYLLQNSNNLKEKFIVLKGLIETFFSNTFGGVVESKYEYELYSMIEKGIPLSSYESLANLLRESKKFFNLPVGREKNLKQFTRAIYIPHYYENFYLYKYSFGILIAFKFFDMYKKEGTAALKKYINQFLSKGDSKWPLQIIRDAGIDPEKKETYHSAFEIFNKFLNEWIKIGKQLFLKDKK